MYAHVAEPAGEKAPTTQAWHDALKDAPAAALARPAGQGSQYALPENSLKYPGAHAVQVEAPAKLNLPGLFLGQCVRGGEKGGGEEGGGGGGGGVIIGGG